VPAVGNERTHAQLTGERAVLGFSVSPAARRCNGTGEAEGVGLASSTPYLAAERRGFLGVAPSLVGDLRWRAGNRRGSVKAAGGREPATPSRRVRRGTLSPSATARHGVLRRVFPPHTSGGGMIL